MANKSAFVRTHLDDPKRKKVVSVYSSTKAYCPTTYWWSIRAAADRGALAGFKKQMAREMQQVGFPAVPIAHYEMLFVTNPTPDFAKSAFKKAF